MTYSTGMRLDAGLVFLSDSPRHTGHKRNADSLPRAQQFNGKQP